jgi:hypothetical protein
VLSLLAPVRAMATVVSEPVRGERIPLTQVAIAAVQQFRTRADLLLELQNEIEMVG